VQIAERLATRHGYKLSDYQSPQVLAGDASHWMVYFEMKPPTPVGGHFHVLIDRVTKKVTLIPGL
jgi:hypothetical protein